MNRGVPPTDEKALTGEFTPPGMTAHASANSVAEAATDDRVRFMTTSVPAQSNASTTGCSGSALGGDDEDRVVGLARQAGLDKGRSEGTRECAESSASSRPTGSS